MNYEIGAYTANDLVATVNLDSVNREGTYELEIDVKSAHSADKCTIVSVTPDTVEVKFDHIDSTKFPVSVSAPNVSAADGFTLKESTVAPEEIEVEGPEDELERIDKVVAVYADSLTLSEDTTVSTDSLLFYDADDNLLDSTNYTLSNKKVDISFSVYRKVTATVKADFTGVPPDFDLSSLPYTISPNSLQIITPQLDGSPTEEIKLNSISLYEITSGKTFKYAIDDLLSSGEINQSGIDQVDVSFDLSDYEQKTFSLPASQITFINMPTGKEVEIDVNKLTNVTIFGPKSVMEDLEVSDLTAQIDLSDVSANGSVSHEVMIYSKTHHNIWNIGTHEAVITVSDKGVSSSAAEE
jgi:YbbR domain-containing protein